MNARLIKIFLMCLCFIMMTATVLANDGAACEISSPPQQNPQNPSTPSYNVVLANPVSISSQQAGYQNTACAAATFAAASRRSDPKDANGASASQTSIINACATAAQITATTAGPLDLSIQGLIAFLNQDPINCYELTLKRADGYVNLPVTTLPTPQVRIQRNVKVEEYKPYNIRVADIAQALSEASSVPGGIGIGAVAYDSSNVDTDQHMFQPRAINTVATGSGTNQRNNFKVYDPYFGTEIDVSIAFDNDGRMYTNIWNRGGNDIWFHFEDMFFVKNIGPCVNNTNWTVNYSGGGGGRITGTVVKGPTTGNPPAPIATTPASPRTGPTTPMGCGYQIQATNTCSNPGACPPNQYCNYARSCSCKANFCGDRVLDPGEQCDDGNTNNNDACSTTCRKQELCPGNNQWMLSSAIECESPGEKCLRISHGSMAYGICSSSCTCEPREPITPV